jgi:hypothetical protein
VKAEGAEPGAAAAWAVRRAAATGKSFEVWMTDPYGRQHRLATAYGAGADLVLLLPEALPQ